MIDSHHQCRQVDVGRQDMRLVTEVGTAPDDIVSAVIDLCNPMRCVTFRRYITFHHLHIVAYGYGVCGADTTNTEVAFHTAIQRGAVRELRYQRGRSRGR